MSVLQGMLMTVESGELRAGFKDFRFAVLRCAMYWMDVPSVGSSRGLLLQESAKY